MDALTVMSTMLAAVAALLSAVSALASWRATNKKLGYWTARLYVDVAEVRIPEETTDDLREPLEVSIR